MRQLDAEHGVKENSREAPVSSQFSPILETIVI
jgi:hypothetical protein